MKEQIQEKIHELLNWVVPDSQECRRAAMEMIARSPNTPRETLAKQMVRDAQKRAATVGGVTGLAASPFTMLPAAIADIAAVLKIEGTLAGGIAALLDPASLDDPEGFRADVLAIVFPAAVSQAVRQIGLRAGEQVTKALVRRAAGKGGLETLFRIAGKFVGAKLTGKTMLTKSVPLVSVGIGAGWNWMEASAIGNRAIAYHLGRPVLESRLKEIGVKLTPAALRGRLWGRGA